MYKEAAKDGFTKEYGYIVFQFVEGCEYIADTNEYWTTPITGGTAEIWDPNYVSVVLNDYENISVVAIVHLHVDLDGRGDNGGFSAKDLATMPTTYESYVMVLSRASSEINGRYIVYQYNSVGQKGKEFYYGN